MPAQGWHGKVRREMWCEVRCQETHEKRQVRRKQRNDGRQVRSKMRSQMRSKVRSQELMAVSRVGLSKQAGGATRAAGLCLLETYADLAHRKAHLLGSLLAGKPPKQWAHYPQDDAIDVESGFQWFYHSHALEDRTDSGEHGHIHLFARRRLWSRRLRSDREIQFAQLLGDPEHCFNTRHLLCIGFDAKGLPTSLFTVNSWVTGDLMLSAQTTADLLGQLTLSTGNTDVDAVVESLIRLYRKEIRALLDARDTCLFSSHCGKVLADESLEVLSELEINVDEKLASVL